MLGLALLARTPVARRDAVPRVGWLIGALGTEPQLSASGRDLVVRVYGEEPAVLRTAAARVQAALASTRGVVDARALATPSEPTVEIEVDLAAAERRGTKPATCGVRRPRCCRGSRSAACSSSRRCSTCSSSARPPAVAA